jgi:hypothetical protein
MSGTNSYSINNIIINTKDKFDCPPPFQLLHTTPSSSRRSLYQTKPIPQREKKLIIPKKTYTIGLDLRGGGSDQNRNITCLVDVRLKSDLSMSPNVQSCLLGYTAV